MSKIRVFVGCAANNDDLESLCVLEHSIRSRTKAEVEIFFMRLSRDPSSPFFGWRTQMWSTPFSGFRWIIPELCGYHGRAIYTDSDVIFLADIAELWSTPFRPGKIVVGKGGGESWRLCVSLWDCAAARPHMLKAEALKAAPGGHATMISRFRHSTLVQPFAAGDWNVIDGEDYADLADPRIKALHYSSEAHQPHLEFALPRLAREKRKHWFDGKVRTHWRRDVRELFHRELIAANSAGFMVDQYRAPDFGLVHLTSHAGYRGNHWTPKT